MLHSVIVRRNHSKWLVLLLVLCLLPLSALAIDRPRDVKGSFNDDMSRTITWSAVEGALGYRIYEKLSSGRVRIGDTKEAHIVVPSSRFDVRGSSHSFVVTAYDAFSESIDSSSDYCRVPYWYLDAPVLSANQDVLWVALQTYLGEYDTFDYGAHYVIERQVSDGPFEPILTLTQALLTVTNQFNRFDKFTKFGETYTYRVYAVNSLTQSPMSNTVTVRFEDRFTMASTDLTSVTATERRASLAWKDELTGAAGYNIYRSTDGINYSYHLSTTSKSIYDTDVDQSRAYAYRVRAYSGNLESAWSNARSVVVPGGAPLSMPIIHAINSKDTTVDVYWNAVEGATGYHVYRSTNDSEFVRVDSTTEPAFHDTKVAAGNVYLYRIQAYNTKTSSLAGPPASSAIKRGDANTDGNIDVDDVLCIIDYLRNGTPCRSMINADANADKEVTIDDILWIIRNVIP